MRIRCPLCGRELEAPDDHPSRPFCSLRCKQIDLSNWFGEAYGVDASGIEDGIRLQVEEGK